MVFRLRPGTSGLSAREEQFLRNLETQGFKVREVFQKTSKEKRVIVAPPGSFIGQEKIVTLFPGEEFGRVVGGYFGPGEALPRQLAFKVSELEAKRQKAIKAGKLEPGFLKERAAAQRIVFAIPKPGEKPKKVITEEIIRPTFVPSAIIPTIKRVARERLEAKKEEELMKKPPKEVLGAEFFDFKERRLVSQEKREKVAESFRKVEQAALEKLEEIQKTRFFPKGTVYGKDIPKARKMFDEGKISPRELSQLVKASERRRKQSFSELETLRKRFDKGFKTKEEEQAAADRFNKKLKKFEDEFGEGKGFELPTETFVGAPKRFAGKLITAVPAIGLATIKPVFDPKGFQEDIEEIMKGVAELPKRVKEAPITTGIELGAEVAAILLTGKLLGKAVGKVKKVKAKKLAKLGKVKKLDLLESERIIAEAEVTLDAKKVPGRDIIYGTTQAEVRAVLERKGIFGKDIIGKEFKATVVEDVKFFSLKEFEKTGKEFLLLPEEFPKFIKQQRGDVLVSLTKADEAIGLVAEKKGLLFETRTKRLTTFDIEPSKPVTIDLPKTKELIFEPTKKLIETKEFRAFVPEFKLITKKPPKLEILPRPKPKKPRIEPRVKVLRPEQIIKQEIIAIGRAKDIPLEIEILGKQDIMISKILAETRIDIPKPLFERGLGFDPLKGKLLTRVDIRKLLPSTKELSRIERTVTITKVDDILITKVDDLLKRPKPLKKPKKVKPSKIALQEQVTLDLMARRTKAVTLPSVEAMIVEAISPKIAMIRGEELGLRLAAPGISRKELELSIRTDVLLKPLKQKVKPKRLDVGFKTSVLMKQIQKDMVKQQQRAMQREKLLTKEKVVTREAVSTRDIVRDLQRSMQRQLTLTKTRTITKTKTLQELARGFGATTVSVPLFRTPILPFAILKKPKEVKKKKKKKRKRKDELFFVPGFTSKALGITAEIKDLEKFTRGLTGFELRPILKRRK